MPATSASYSESLEAVSGGNWQGNETNGTSPDHILMH